MGLTINRKVPLITQGNLLFGGFINQFGWIFFGFGMIFFWVFALDADLSFIHFTGKTITVQGIATDSFETGASENDVSVYENHYRFTTPQEDEYVSYSYATGRVIKAGQAVTVEYPEDKPEYSRIKGMRRHPFGPAVLLVAIFPIVGLAFIFFGLKSSLRAIRLFKQGELTTGRLIAKEPTNTTINEQRVYKLTFCFKDQWGDEHEVSAKTHHPHLLEDDREERLFYLKDNPKYAAMLDALPSSPSLDERGNITPAPFIKSLLPLIIPLITFLGHGAYVYLQFIR